MVRGVSYRPSKAPDGFSLEFARYSHSPCARNQGLSLQVAESKIIFQFNLGWIVEPFPLRGRKVWDRWQR